MSKNHSFASPVPYFSPVCKVVEVSPLKPVLVASYGEEGEAGAVRDVVSIEEEF